MSLPRHGGDLARAVQHYGGRTDQWLDLSTGIAPYSWPAEKYLSQAPASCWQDLPAEPLQRACRDAVAQYYGARLMSLTAGNTVLAAGSQAIIQQLPFFFASDVFAKPLTELHIWCLAGSYGEHEYRWQQAGARLQHKTAAQLREALTSNQRLPDILLLVNPDNPSGLCWSTAEMIAWQRRLAAQQSWLIIDAAFIDALAKAGTETPLTVTANTLMLTSIGKFFGLAGLRLGAALLDERLAEALASRLGPWPVSGLSLWLATRALQDRHWQQQQHQRLEGISQQLLEACAGLPLIGSTRLFMTFEHPEVAVWQQQLAQQKIWTRCYVRQQRLRIGMPQQQDVTRLLGGLNSLYKN